MPTLLTILAMDKESKDFAATQGFVKSQRRLTIAKIPAEIYEKSTANCAQFLVISGPCPLHGVNIIGPAIIGLALSAMDTFKPDYVLNAGFAGGFARRGAAIGDVYVGSGPVFNHDRLFTADDPYKAYGEGSFPTFPADQLAAAIGAKLGRVTSSGSMLFSAEEMANMERFGTVVKDMEAGAIAQAACIMGVPFIPIKVITDCVDHPVCSQEQFNANYPKLVANLHTAMLRAFDFLVTQ